nr:retropepsin-like aspartic protease [Comamonas jiangduensis]
MMAKAATRRRHTGRSLWRLNLGMALFWLVALGVMYVAMERYLQPSRRSFSNGSLQLQRQRDGHFYADGSINGQPVRFMVDTGASSIAVTDALAQRAGLEGGQVVQFQTANGPRMGRLVRAQNIQVGPLQVRNRTVGTGYTGRTAQDALLGQNFLRQFQVSIQGDVLELRRLQK